MTDPIEIAAPDCPAEMVAVRDTCARAERAERDLAAARACIAACEERISEWCNYCGGNRTTCDNAPGQCPARAARAAIKETK